MNKQITSDVNCVLDYIKRSVASRLCESISFSDDETTAGIWGPLSPEGCQETGEGPVLDYKDAESQQHVTYKVKLKEMCLFSLLKRKPSGPSESMTM